MSFLRRPIHSFCNCCHYLKCFGVISKIIKRWKMHLCIHQYLVHQIIICLKMMLSSILAEVTKLVIWYTAHVRKRLPVSRRQRRSENESTSTTNVKLFENFQIQNIADVSAAWKPQKEIFLCFIWKYCQNRMRKWFLGWYLGFQYVYLPCPSRCIKTL